MTATMTRKPKTSKTRTCRLNGDTLTLTIGKDWEQYRLLEVEREGVARTFTLRRLETPKREEETYAVTMGGGDRYSCTCPGCQHHGHCKHGLAAIALIKAGKL